MHITKVAGVLLAVLLVVGGTAAALPGDAPADVQADEHAQADKHAQADSQSANESEAERRGPPTAVGPSGDAGPPADLPAQVPHFVSEIHDLVRDHLAGLLDVDLGSAIADVTPGEETDADDGEVPMPTPDGNTSAPPA